MSIAAAVLGLVTPGDEVVVIEPSYDSYAAVIALAGGVRRTVPLRFPDLSLDPRELAAAFSDRTRVVVVNSPHNPTGKVFTADELALVAELARRHDAWVLSDEELRRYLADIVGDIASNYEIDGVILDRIRYPQTAFTRENRDFGYHPEAIERFNRLHRRSGVPDPRDPEWIAFRQEAITDTVEAIHRRLGEIDVVARRDGCLVFCEVKTRRAGTVAGPDGPLDAIGPAKRRRLRRLAAEWLPRLATGEVRVGVGFGPDVHGGGVPVVVQAAACDLFVLFDRGEVHLVPPSAVDLEPVRSVDGARHLARVTWSPSPETLLVDGEPGFRATNEAFDRAALGAAAMLVGLSRRMLDMAVQYASERRQFGVPIGSFQAVKHQLADASLAVEFAEPLVLRAANSVAHHDPSASVHVSMAKAKASDAANGAARTSLQVHGAIGYTVEYDLHLYMKRAWSLAARFGDAAFHRRRVRAAVLEV